MNLKKNGKNRSLLKKGDYIRERKIHNHCRDFVFPGRDGNIDGDHYCRLTIQINQFTQLITA